MTDRFNSGGNLEVKREPDLQGVGSNSPSSANVQVKNERLNGYPDDGGKHDFFALGLSINDIHL